jgi:hypothetical protein
MRNPSNLIGNRNRFLPACITVPQPMVPPSTPSTLQLFLLKWWIGRRKFYLHIPTTKSKWHLYGDWILWPTCTTLLWRQSERRGIVFFFLILFLSRVALICRLGAVNCFWIHDKKNWLFKIFVPKSQHNLLKEGHDQYQNVCAKIFPLVRHFHM